MVPSLRRSSRSSSLAVPDAGHAEEGADDEETVAEAAALTADSLGPVRRRTTAGGKADETYVPI